MNQAQWDAQNHDDLSDYSEPATPAREVGAEPVRHGELSPEAAMSTARAALGYAGAFDGKGINWQSDEPWPHRIELAQALDWITDLGAMVLNLAERVASPPSPPVGRQETDTVPWPVVSRYTGGASPEGVAGRVWLRLGDGPEEVEYAPVGRQEAIPEGWQLVPNTATHNMLNAANAGRKKGSSSSGAIYEAMLSAAPAPPERAQPIATPRWLMPSGQYAYGFYGWGEPDGWVTPDHEPAPENWIKPQHQRVEVERAPDPARAALAELVAAYEARGSGYSPERVRAAWAAAKLGLRKVVTYVRAKEQVK